MVNQSLSDWQIFGCLGSHDRCPQIWKNKFIDHRIVCFCKCHDNRDVDTEK